MAQNTVEDTKSAVDKTEISETSTRTIDKADSRNDKENVDEAMETNNAESTFKGNQESEKNDKIDHSTDTLDSKKQLNIKKIDLVEKPREETDSEKESSSGITVETETKENEPEDKCPAEGTNDSDEQVNAFCVEAEEQLNEILKVVQEDLEIEYFKKSPSQSSSVKDDEKDGEQQTNGDEQQTIKTESVEEQESAIVRDAEENKDSRESPEKPVKKPEEEPGENPEKKPEKKSEKKPEKKPEKKSEEKPQEKPVVKSEVGIVGPPTAVSELINEEELGGGDSADPKDHIAEWVEKSAKEDTSTPANAEDEDDVAEGCKQRSNGSEMGAKWKNEDAISISSRKSQKIVSNIIKKSIKCLNKMHAMEGASGNGKNVDAAENAPSTSPKVPQSQQNGAALPEETAASPSALDYGRVKIEKDVHENIRTNKKSLPITSTPIASTSEQKAGSRLVRSKSAEIVGKKRKSPNGQQDPTNGPSRPKKTCCAQEERESSIKSLVGEETTADALEKKENELFKQMQELEEMARKKEKEWNQILHQRKLTEEAYVRLQRRRQMMRLTNSETTPEHVASTSLEARWMNSDEAPSETASREKSLEFKSDLSEESSLNASLPKKQNVANATSQRQTTSSKSGGENSRKQNEMSSPESRQIGEGRQGARVEVTSIIANHRKMFPDPAPKRGRRTRNSVNVNLTAGGAMVEMGHNADSRPSSADSCKSPNATECQNPVNFRDMVFQLNRLSQHQGEPARASQNYPDVTLQPVPSGHNTSSVPENTNTPSRSLLHGILTNNTSSRPNNFPLTLAKLLTAPERERNSPAATAAATPIVPMAQQATGAQHLLQAYQGSSLGSISELLSSSTARTEITITPVVNTPAQSHSNNVINVDDVEEDTASDDRNGKYSMSGRDAREDRDNPPRCQGCHDQPAQFVCAGCANQWYCSRECQVASWDEHSEICSG